MNSKDATVALAALAQESRLELFRLLVKRGPEGYSPGDLMAKLGIPGSTLSFHLNALTHAGLIQARKESRYIYYSPNFRCIDTLIEFLTAHCCSLSSGTCNTGCMPNTAKPKSTSIRRRA